jgi:hypothetical protein
MAERVTRQLELHRAEQSPCQCVYLCLVSSGPLSCTPCSLSLSPCLRRCSRRATWAESVAISCKREEQQSRMCDYPGTLLL